MVEELVGAVAEEVSPDRRHEFTGLFNRLVPFLVQILQTPEDVVEAGTTSVNNSYISICLDITTRFVRSLPKPIPSELVRLIF